jgi:UDPglucose 6-dehydrogenase
MKIGIIGVGFVGTAVKLAYEAADIDTICIDEHKGYYATYDNIMDCQAIFVCVPSPVAEDGSCDTSYLLDVMAKLKDYSGIIISKVTAPPTVYTELSQTYCNLVHAPEFLTAANANEDYRTGQFAIIGGYEPCTQDAARIIRMGQPRIHAIQYVSIGEASLAKYAINTYLATKVIFNNELHNLAKSIGLNYTAVRHAIALDTRIGLSHLDVPGPDGQYGFGGACFPKDTSALLHFAEQNGVELSVLKSAVLTNKTYRSDV